MATGESDAYHPPPVDAESPAFDSAPTSALLVLDRASCILLGRILTGGVGTGQNGFEMGWNGMRKRQPVESGDFEPPPDPQRAPDATRAHALRLQ